MRTAFLAGVMGLGVSAFAMAAETPGKIEFEGLVQERPAAGVVGSWKISGLAVSVTENTRVKEDDGKLAAGGKVDVEGVLNADGSVAATELETER